MSSYSPMGPQGMMETQNNENRPQSTEKNHWVIKLCPHVMIISLLLNVMIKYDVFYLLMAVFWIWMGRNIQKNLFVISKFSGRFLIIISLLEIPTIYKNLQKVPEVFPWTKEIMNWFTGFL